MFYHTPKTPEEKTEKKSFLKKKKDILIDYDHLINLFSFQGAQQLFLNKKKIYIIDNKDINCFTIKLKEVKIIDYFQTPDD